jgi:uncharacterized protein YjgD (DUF1641 family)
MDIKVLEEQVAQQALLAKQAEQAAQQAREAKAKAEQELLEAMVEAEQAEAQQAREADAEVDDEAEAAALYAALKGAVRAVKAAKSKKTNGVMKPPRVEEKIMERSYQRAGVVGEGTLLSSGARQATVTFKPGTFDLLKEAAADNKVSLSEIVRQLVDRGLRPRG